MLPIHFHLRRSPILALALFLVALPATAFELDDLQQQLSIHHGLQGRFEQQHWLEQQQTRLYSDGHFLLQPGQRLVWQFTTPMEATLVFRQDSDAVTPDAEPLIAADNGEVLTELLPGRAEEFRDHPINLLAGDWAALAPYYAMRLEGEADAWQLLLSPRAPVLEVTLSDMRLTGGDTWERLEMRAIDGDELVVEFSNVSPLVDTAAPSLLMEGAEAADVERAKEADAATDDDAQTADEPSEENG